MPNDEFARRLTADIGDAILARLKGDADLVAYFRAGDGIESVDNAGIRLAGSWVAPLLLLEYWAEDEDPGLAGSGELDTLWRLTLLTRSRQDSDTGDWLRLRLIQQIKALLAAEHGMLRDPEGNPLTESVVRFQSIADPEPSSDQATLRTRIRVGYRSQITVMTREFEP